MCAVAVPAAPRRSRTSIDLRTARSLKRALENDFSAAVSPVSVLEAFCEGEPGNLFAQSLREVPLRHIDRLMAAQDSDVIGHALRGRPLSSPIVAQTGEKTPPRMSVGYRLVGEDAFALEVRLQHADVQSLLYAQTIVKQRIGDTVPIGVISKVTGQAGAVHPAALNNDPLTLGSSVACAGGGPGTLGLFMQAGQKLGFLSCSHVLANCGKAKIGDVIQHPAACDDPRPINIGVLRNFANLQEDGPVAMDAAFAELTEGTKVEGNKIPTGYGWPSEGAELGNPVVGNIEIPKPAVAKIGRSSGHTTGVVALENVGPIDIYMSELNGNVAVEGLTEVHWKGLNDPFSKLGDSGSVVYLQDSLRPIGIVVAGGIATIDKVKVGVSYVCPLGPIMKAWGLKPS